MPYSHLTSWVFLSLFLISLMLSSCQSSSNQKAYIELNFTSISQIAPGEWIEIDGVRFEHIGSYEALNEIPFSLPASEIEIDAEEMSHLKEPVPGISIGILLGGMLQRMNQPSSLTTEVHQHTYLVINPDLLQIRGSLQFTRSDSTRPDIQFSDGYPVEIRAVRFDS